MRHTMLLSSEQGDSFLGCAARFVDYCENVLGVPPNSTDFWAEFLNITSQML